MVFSWLRIEMLRNLLEISGKTPSHWEDAITLIAVKIAIRQPTVVANVVLANNAPQQDPEDEYVALFAKFLPTLSGMDIINCMNSHEINRYKQSC